MPLIRNPLSSVSRTYLRCESWQTDAWRIPDFSMQATQGKVTPVSVGNARKGLYSFSNPCHLFVWRMPTNHSLHIKRGNRKFQGVSVLRSPEPYLCCNRLARTQVVKIFITGHNTKLCLSSSPAQSQRRRWSVTIHIRYYCPRHNNSDCCFWKKNHEIIDNAVYDICSDSSYSFIHGFLLIKIRPRKSHWCQ